MRNRLAWLIAPLFAFVDAQAHTKLLESTPADHAQITASPKELMLHFSEVARITSLSLQKADGRPQQLGPLPQEGAAQVRVALPPLPAGTYSVIWRAMGKDNHIVSGKIEFTVQSAKP